MLWLFEGMLKIGFVVVNMVVLLLSSVFVWFVECVVWVGC